MIIGPETEVPESRCPHCKQKLDGAFNVGDNATPSPGNVSLCAVCGNWMIFDRDLKLVKPSPGMLAAIKRDRRCQITYHAIMRVIRSRARNN
jgi:hypothetical protein